MITVLDYGSGNVAAIANLLRLSNVEFQMVTKATELADATHIILPGVGAYDVTMQAFKSADIERGLKDRVDNGAALLGICVGMQVLGTSSEEGTARGLDFVPGRVRRFNPQRISLAAKVPHMGWNALRLEARSPLFEGIDLDRGFYFLHSYYFDCEDANDVLATAKHGDSFHCAIHHGRVFGVQFHPEKSHDNGIRLFRNFSAI